MSPELLRSSAFRGDPDVDELHAFFQSERQFAGDTRWSFGTSLKSAYVHCFEFLNNAPVVQLWRDSAGELQAVSRLNLGDAEWFYLATPEYRRAEVSRAILEQADAAFALLSDHASWRTVCHESDRDAAALLEEHGYTSDGFEEVYMTRSLEAPIATAPTPEGCAVRMLDPADADEVSARGNAQLDAFRRDQPLEEISAWISRTIPHLLSYGRPRAQPHVIAIEPAGRVLAFADTFCDHANKIGEFEPVGTRQKMQRRGLAKAVLARGLAEMTNAGMQTAIVRTGCDNTAAIAAYASVGFEIADRLVNFRKTRG